MRAMHVLAVSLVSTATVLASSHGAPTTEPVILTHGQACSLTGTLEVVPRAMLPRLTEFPVNVYKTVHEHASGLIRLESVAVLGDGYDLASLARIVGPKTPVTVRGGFDVIYTKSASNMPDEAVIVQEVLVDGRRLAPDLPLKESRLETLARQRVLDLMRKEATGSEMPQVDDLKLHRNDQEPLVYYVEIENDGRWPRGPHHRVFRVDLIANRISELKA